MVHNGIIENYLLLKRSLSDRGHTFSSETDTEIIAHLIWEELAQVEPGPDRLLLATRRALQLPVSDTRASDWVAAERGAAIAAPSDGSEAVLDLPISLPVLARSRYAWDAAHHGLAIPYGLNDPSPDALLKNRLGLALMNLERSSVDTLAPELPTLDLVLGARALAAEGLSTIVVHRALYPAALRDRVLTLLEIAVGPGEAAGIRDQPWWRRVS